MIDEEDINFIKVFLIIMKGGTILCRKLVLALVTITGKSLENILQGHRQDLTTETSVHKHLTRVQFEKLFPRNNQAIDINQWDISLLTFVLLNVFGKSLNSPIKAAVETLRDKRNNIVAHRSDSKLTKDEFRCIWPHVTMAMRQLARELTSDDEMEYIDIETKLYSKPLQTSTVEELEMIELTDSLTQSIIDHIMPKIKEEIVNEDVLRRLEKLEKEKDIQGRQIALLAKMQVNTGSASSKRQVQEHILEASNNIISKDPDVYISEDEVESAVGDLFNGMEEQGVKVEKADKGSILLTILCPTIKCLRDILVYLNSPQLKYKLKNIEKAADKYHACETKIAVDIDLHSLETTVNRLEEELDVGAVYLTLKCSGTRGVKNAFQMFENGESTNTLNKLSEALSHKVGEKVELLTCIDKDRLEDEIKKENERRKEEEITLREEKQDFERTNHDAEMLNENTYNIRGSKEMQQQIEENLETMKENEERSGKMENEIKEEEKHFERKKYDEEIRKLKEDRFNRTTTIYDEMMKLKEDLLTRTTTIYDEMMRLKEDHLRKIVEKEKSFEGNRQQLLLKQYGMENEVEEEEGKLHFENIKYDKEMRKLKEDLFERTTKFYEEMRRFKEYHLREIVGKKIRPKGNRQQLLLKKYGMEKEEDERKLSLARQYLDSTQHRRLKEVRQKNEEDLEKMKKSGGQLLKKEFGPETERHEEDERKLREERQYFQRTKHDEERRKGNEYDFGILKEVRQQLEDDIEKMNGSCERSRQLLKQFGKMETKRKEEDERILAEKPDVYKEMWEKNNDDLRRIIEERRMFIKPLEKLRKSNKRSQHLLENLLELDMPEYELLIRAQLEENEAVIRRLNKKHDQSTDELNILRERATQRQKQLYARDYAHVTDAVIGGIAGVPVGVTNVGTVVVAGGLLAGGSFRSSLGGTFDMVGGHVRAAIDGTVGMAEGPVGAEIGGRVSSVFDRLSGSACGSASDSYKE